MPARSADDIGAWDAVADDWARIVRAGQDPHREQILDPAMLALLGDVAGLRVLDAGCGEGRFSRMLAERGARVVGVDVSARMVELARSYCRHPFIHHALLHPHPDTARTARMMYYQAKNAVMAMKIRHLYRTGQFPLTRSELRRLVRDGEDVAIIDVVERWPELRPVYEEHPRPLMLQLDAFARRLVESLPRGKGQGTRGKERRNAHPMTPDP